VALSSIAYPGLKSGVEYGAIKQSFENHPLDAPEYQEPVKGCL